MPWSPTSSPERLSRSTIQGAKDNDIVLVEGQGSLITRLLRRHARPAARVLPDALILCHQVSATTSALSRPRAVGEDPSYTEMIEIYERAAHPVHPTKVIGSAQHVDMTRARRAGLSQERQRRRGYRRRSGAFDSDLLVDAIIGRRCQKND